MPEVTYDGRSFTIDGRRIWLVSGQVAYARVPRGLWRSRLRAAKQAGLNCVETPVVWNAHEQEPGVIDFDGELDLRAFVQTAADEGLYVILRPGPYIGIGWDFGGLPAYLHGLRDKEGGAKFREYSPLVLEAVDRFWRALMKQVGDLQAASSDGGPIVLMQVEHDWRCHNPEQGEKYLQRLVSMLRQHGVAVPITNNNNLWQPVEGTIDTWSGGKDLPVIMRQLAAVQPEAPAMVSDLITDTAEADPAYRLGSLVGVGAQFNIMPFHGDSDTASDSVPLQQAGGRGPAYDAVKRLCTFASQFGHVLAAAEREPAAAIAPQGDHTTAVYNLRGSQGELVMLLKSAKDKSKHTPLLLPNGLTLDVPHAGQRAAWVLINANLGGVANLDFTNLSPWALIDKKLLVVFGPAGAEAHISIDGEHRSVTVPTSKTPVVLEGDPINVVVLNQDQVDAAYESPAGLVIGCDGLDRDDNPRARSGWGTQFIVTTDGEVSRKRVSPAKKPTAPKLGVWQTLSLKPMIDGTDDSYQPIDGPADMGTLGQAFGYGWYRFSPPKPVNDSLCFVDGGDRLHLYNEGKLAALLGTGEGASAIPTKVKLKGETVVLANNLGRGAYGSDLKGLAGHFFAVKPIKPAKPQRGKHLAGDPFAVVGYAYGQRAGARPMCEAITWAIKPESRKPVIVELNNCPAGVISINDEPLHDTSGGQPERLLLDPADDGPMTGGKNTIKLELLEPAEPDAKVEEFLRFYQTTAQVTPKDGLAFAPWTVPVSEGDAWRILPKTLPSQPAWLRCSFTVESLDSPLWFVPEGLSKGQAYLNGHDLGGYFHQTREGKRGFPYQPIYLPEPWLNTDGPNELMLFDEHGRTPGRCKLAYDA